jgi:hypothetical protein
MRLNGEALEHISELAHLWQPESFRENLGGGWGEGGEGGDQKEDWNGLKEVQETKFTLADKSRKTETKKDVLKTCVLPVLLYGAETRSLTKKKNALQTCQRDMKHVAWSDREKNDGEKV